MATGRYANVGRLEGGKKLVEKCVDGERFAKRPEKWACFDGYEEDEDDQDDDDDDDDDDDEDEDEDEDEDGDYDSETDHDDPIFFWLQSFRWWLC